MKLTDVLTWWRMCNFTEAFESTFLWAIEILVQRNGVLNLDDHPDETVAVYDKPRQLWTQEELFYNQASPISHSMVVCVYEKLAEVGAVEVSRIVVDGSPTLHVNVPIRGKQ